MADFKMKLITLAGAATMFAGMAYGQATCNAALAANPVFIRLEGLTEQVADVTATCTVAVGANPVVAGQTANMTVYLSPSVPITSAVIGVGNNGNNNTPPNETTAGVGVAGAPFSATAGAKVNGTITGSSVVFSGIVLPAIAVGGTVNLTVTNIKVNATTIAGGTGIPTAVSEQVFFAGTGLVPTVSNVTAVAYAQSGLANVKVNNAFSNPICSAISANTSGKNGDGQNFQVQFGKGFASAFKIQGGAANVNIGSEFANGTETGFYVATNGATNQATSGTRLQVVFGNIPNNVTVYVPVTITDTGNNPSSGGVLSLTSSPTGPISLIAAGTQGSTAIGAPNSPDTAGQSNGATAGNDKNAGSGLYAAFTPAAGSLTVVYEVTTATPSSIDLYNMAVFLQAKAGAVAAPSGAITASVSFAPVGSPTNVPNFVINSSTSPQTASSFTACSTTLLFPFVTNQVGFDTGIAIANTSTDLLGTKNGAAVSTATAASGTCNISFFGNTPPTTQPMSFVPNSGTIGAQKTDVGPVYATTVSVLAPGFQGYAIASCNFLYGHGYAFLLYNLAAPNALSQGYLADVIAGDRSSFIPNVTNKNITALGVLTGITVTSANSGVSSTAPEVGAH